MAMWRAKTSKEGMDVWLCREVLFPSWPRRQWYLGCIVDNAEWFRTQRDARKAIAEFRASEGLRLRWELERVAEDEAGDA